MADTVPAWHVAEAEPEAIVRLRRRAACPAPDGRCFYRRVVTTAARRHGRGTPTVGRCRGHRGLVLADWCPRRDSVRSPVAGKPLAAGLAARLHGEPSRMWGARRDDDRGRLLPAGVRIG